MKSAARGRSTLPDDTRIYALSDVHGCADLLARALRAIDRDMRRGKPSRTFGVFLGDYVDRGGDSRRTLDLLVEWARREPAVFLRGNHEEFLLRFLEDPTLLQEWRRFGGLQTLMSYGLKPSVSPGGGEQFDLARALAAALPDDHLIFLNGLRTSFSCGDFFFAHAGARPGVPLDQQKDQDLLWIREEFLAADVDLGKFIVHGHTPVRAPDLRPHRVNIDTGAYATGQLTLLRIEGTSLDFIDI